MASHGGKYTGWLASDELEGDVVNLFMDYETFGEHQRADTGIFDFMKALVPAVLKREGLEFATVSEAAAKYQPVAVLHCPHVMSWADEERDITAWLGNELQNEAFGKLYALRDKIARLKDPDFDHVWNFMQASDHFYYMATKWLSDGDVHAYFNPYESSYDAFINYMNVLSDFEIEVEKAFDRKPPVRKTKPSPRKRVPIGRKPGCDNLSVEKAVRHNRQTASLLSVSWLDHVRRYTLFAVNLDALYFTCFYIPEKGCAEFLDLTRPFLFRDASVRQLPLRLNRDGL